MYGLPAATVRGLISVGLFDDTPDGTLAVVAGERGDDTGSSRDSCWKRTGCRAGRTLTTGDFLLENANQGV